MQAFDATRAVCGWGWRCGVYSGRIGLGLFTGRVVNELFINVLVFKNINAMFECYPWQERMKEWQKRSCRLQRWCLTLLQKTQGDTRRVQDCQKHPCQLACLISIRWFIVSTIPSMKSSQASLARNPKTSPELPWGCRWDGGCARYRLHKSLIPCQRWEDTKEGIPQPLKLVRNSTNVLVDTISRLPCNVFFICVLTGVVTANSTNRNQNINNLSWAFNMGGAFEPSGHVVEKKIPDHGKTDQYNVGISIALKQPSYMCWLLQLPKQRRRLSQGDTAAHISNIYNNRQSMKVVCKRGRTKLAEAWKCQRDQ